MNCQWQLKRKQKLITKLNQWSGCKWPSGSSCVLPPSDCWPKFFDRNVYWKLPPLSIVYFHIYWDYLVHFFSFKNSFLQNFLNVVRETNWQYHFIQQNWWSWQRRSVVSRFTPSESWYRPAIETWQKTIRVSSHPVIGNLSHPTCFQVFWKKYLAETLKMTPPHRSILI